jgi:hypothetical protein
MPVGDVLSTVRRSPAIVSAVTTGVPAGMTSPSPWSNTTSGPLMIATESLIVWPSNTNVLSVARITFSVYSQGVAGLATQ